MNIKVLVLLLILSNRVQAQMAHSSYKWMDKDSTSCMKIAFDEKGEFEFSGRSMFSCITAYFIYGRGKSERIGDSILLAFDSFPTLHSSSRLDSLENQDKIVDIQIKVLDEEGNLMDGLILSWGIAGRKRATFYRKEFHKTTQLALKRNKKLNFLRIEKEGYYWGAIEMPKKPSKDYRLEVILRPKPRMTSANFISNQVFPLAIISENELELGNGIFFRKENGH